VFLPILTSHTPALAGKGGAQEKPSATKASAGKKAAGKKK